MIGLNAFRNEQTIRKSHQEIKKRFIECNKFGAIKSLLLVKVKKKKLYWRISNTCILQKAVLVPDMNVVKAIQKISWTAAGGLMDLLHCSQEEIHKAFEKVRFASSRFDLISVTKVSKLYGVYTRRNYYNNYSP